MTKDTVRSKDGLRTVGMYPLNCREISFKYNDKYQKEYLWPGGDLLSPSRVFDGTSDKSGIERWRKKVGDEEADRIIEESISIGKSMHQYLEKSILKFCNIKYQNHPPIINPELHPHHNIAYKLGAQILEKGLKNRLEEVWGLESHLYYEHFFRGIVDCVGIYEGEPCIVDFKQKRKMPQRQYIEDYFMQVAAYGICHNSMTGTKIKKGVVLIVDRQFNFKKFVIEGNEWKHYCREFCDRLEQFIEIDCNNKEEAWKTAQLRRFTIERLKRAYDN